MTNERTEQIVNELLYVTEHLSKQVEALNEQMTSEFEAINERMSLKLSSLDRGFAKNLNKMVNHIDRDSDRLSQGIEQIVSIFQGLLESDDDGGCRGGESENCVEEVCFRIAKRIDSYMEQGATREEAESFALNNTDVNFLRERLNKLHGKRSEA